MRYRGYYWDAESGLYYLKTRYYDPQVRRFLNADSAVFTAGTLGTNLVAYCNNNPVNAVDSDGRLAQTMTGGGGAGSGASGVGISGNRPWSPPRPQAPISGNRPWSPPPQVSGGGAGLPSAGSLVDLATTMADGATNIWAYDAKKMSGGSGPKMKYINKTTAVVGKIGAGIAYAGAGFDVVSGIADNVDNGVSGVKVFHDVVVDATLSFGTVWATAQVPATAGAIAGTVIPGLGNVIGGLIGLVAGAIIGVAVNIPGQSGTSLRDDLKALVS